MCFGSIFVCILGKPGRREGRHRGSVCFVGERKRLGWVVRGISVGVLRSGEEEVVKRKGDKSPTLNLWKARATLKLGAGKPALISENISSTCRITRDYSSITNHGVK